MTRAGLVRAALATATALAFAGATPASAAGGNPFERAELFVDRKSEASVQVAQWSSTRSADATALRKIATRPQADWFGDWSADVRGLVDDRVAQIDAAGALPVLVAYNLPFRDCGGPSGGGARSISDYASWVRRFADGIGRRPAAVVLEPDGLAKMGCLAPSERKARIAAVRRAVATIERRPGASVYIDAGHSNWVPAETMARRLRRAGVGRARGFALNVANFQPTPAEVGYGQTVSRLVGGKPFVIDTSRNGLGPAPGGAWCNPPGRGLGPKPRTEPGPARVDAYLWIKHPGESDGRCNGGPAAGEWWGEYALGLARRAHD